MFWVQRIIFFFFAFLKSFSVCMKTLHFISRNWRKENSTVAYWFRTIKIPYFDYLKRFNNRINEVYDFSKNIATAIFYCKTRNVTNT